MGQANELLLVKLMMNLIYSDPSYQAEIKELLKAMHYARLTSAKELLEAVIKANVDQLDAVQVDELLANLDYSSDYLRVNGVVVFEDYSNPCLTELNEVWNKLFQQFMLFFSRLEELINAEQLVLTGLSIPIMYALEELREFVISFDYYFERDRVFSQ